MGHPGSHSPSLLQNAARRRALLATLGLLTCMYTWSAVRQLSELIEAQPELPAAGSLLERAEANIASHLHIQGASSESAGPACCCAAAAA